MLCEECGINEATVHIQAIAPDGTTSSRALCQSCMEKFKASKMGMGALDISGILGALMGKIAAKGSELAEKTNDKYDGECESCGTKYAAFRKSGVLGCPQCYKAFRERVEENLIRLNGTALYVEGAENTQRTESASMKVRRLKDEMKRAIETEEFETAARLRDEIKQLQTQAEAEKEALI